MHITLYNAPCIKCAILENVILHHVCIAHCICWTLYILNCIYYILYIYWTMYILYPVYIAPCIIAHCICWTLYILNCTYYTLYILHYVYIIPCIHILHRVSMDSLIALKALYNGAIYILHVDIDYTIVVYVDKLYLHLLPHCVYYTLH